MTGMVKVESFRVAPESAPSSGLHQLREGADSGARRSVMSERPLEIEVVQRGSWFTWYLWDGDEIPKMSVWSYPRESWALYFAERAARRYDRRGRPRKERSSTRYTFPT